VEFKARFFAQLDDTSLDRLGFVPGSFGYVTAAPFWNLKFHQYPGNKLNSTCTELPDSSFNGQRFKKSVTAFLQTFRQVSGSLLPSRSAQ
jgi:hypothetical protein